MSIEVETHHAEHKDPVSKLIGIQVAILAILLSVFTIISHRTHTETIVLGNDSTNEWSHYQAKRIRAYQIEMNTGLVKLLAADSPERKATLEDYAKQSEKYKKDLEEIKTEADAKVKEGEITHHKASYFDLAEGLLEIAMILSSMFFLTQIKLFPGLGLLLGIGGIIVGVLGFMIH